MNVKHLYLFTIYFVGKINDIGCFFEKDVYICKL